jgi:rhodanese-related sulfurtransferase
MIKNKIHTVLYCIVCILIFSGCEKDKVTAPFSVTTETNAEFLLYLEEAGDIINNIIPPVIQAEEVYNNLGNYLILDLRDSITFNNGHIQGAMKISNDSIYNYVQVNHSRFNKVVMISASGQLAAYYSSLLQIAGFDNIYYMNYGMASWNVLFSAVWMDRISTYNDADIFSHTFYTRSKYSPLPEIKLNSPGESMLDLLKGRIQLLLKEGFNEDYYSVNQRSAMTFNYWLNSKSQLFTICTGPIELYSTNPFTTNTYHLIESIYFQIFPDPSDFRSTSHLQTIPTDSSIAIYSATGQESAFYTAYLRLLGYDARSILFGVNNIDYNMLLREPKIAPFAFKKDYIKNYPYVTGSD